MPRRHSISQVDIIIIFLWFFLLHLLPGVIDFVFFFVVAPIYSGIAIYFLSPLWPYTVNTAVSLDSGPITVIDLVDHSRPNTGQGPETAQYQVVWNATGLANTQHNLRISVGAGQPFAVVDGLMYGSFSSSLCSRRNYAC